MVDRYVKEETGSKLATFINDKADESQLLGDIHGYIARQAWYRIPVISDPTGSKLTISSILRDLYLVNKKNAGSPQQYLTYFEEVSGKQSTEIKAFITDRVLRFARPWFAKKAQEHKGAFDSIGRGRNARNIINSYMKDFDTNHNLNEQKAGSVDKIGGQIDKLIQMIQKKMP